MSRLQRGFTLIELMIIVAIVGILAAVAMPAYQDYTVRAKMSEVILALSNCRTAVTEIYQGGAASPPGANNWGCEAAGTSKYVSGITSTADGMLTATVQNITGLTGQVVTLTPLAAADTPAEIGNTGNGLFGWRCGAFADGTNIASKYLPSSCRS
jgi:type IV pilus assembly protein PilA